MSTPKLTYTLSLLLFYLINTSGQDTIYLRNPSFEDVPRKGSAFSAPIKGWTDCGHVKFPNESPPDVHPDPKTSWGVSTEADDGQTYLGLVTRFNDSWESVSQKLNIDLKPDVCYSFCAFLCMSPVYLSPTLRSHGATESFAHPIQLRVYGGNEECDFAELLSITPAVDNTTWRFYTLDFRPSKSFNSISLVAFYKGSKNASPESGRYPYNGHILIDHLSPIWETECR